MKRLRKGKGSADVQKEINRSGVVIEEEVYVPGQVDVHGRLLEGGELAPVPRMTMLEMKFLKEYALDMDAKRAAAAAGYSNPDYGYRLVKKESLQPELARIHQVFIRNLEMTAESASARHLKLMEKFERDYDRIEDYTERAKMASPLARMSDSYLKAAGAYKGENGDSGTNIVINIDLGTEEVVKPVIEGDVVDE